MSTTKDVLTALDAAVDGWQQISGSDRSTVLDTADRFYRGTICPLAADLVRCTPAYFPDPDNPPRPRHSDDCLPELLTGAASTLTAGKRLVFWSAAIADPELCHRSVPSDRNALIAWARIWFVYGDRSIKGWRTIHQPVNWIAEAIRASVPSVEPNEERDRWLYELGQSGLPWPKIRLELAKESQARGWEPIESESGIRAAIDRFLARHPELPPRRERRRRK